MTDRQISVRGTAEGLIVDIGAGDWEGLLRELDRRLSQSASFFRSGRVALRVGARILNRDEIEALGRALQKWDVSLWGIESESLETRAAAASLGLETRLLGGRLFVLPPTAEPEPPAGPSGVSASEGLAVRRTLRSGASLVHRGHILIIGDVNPGAEVIAGGDIVVWGKLRGLAHAGAEGDDAALVCALRLLPSQLRIGSHVSPQPGGARPARDVPRMALVRDDAIVIEAWTDAQVLAGEPSSNLFQRLWRRLAGSSRNA